MKHVLLFCAILGLNYQLAAAPVEPRIEESNAWYNVSQWRVEGQGWTNGLASRYDRLPARAEQTVPKLVWSYSRETAGLCARFYTDATSIQIRYRLTSSKLSHGWGDMSNQSASGFDLYAQTTNSLTGQLGWFWAGSTKPMQQTNSEVLAKGLAPGRRLYTVYFPVYNGVEEVEIGVSKDATFEPVAPRQNRPIAVYGTSIIHGGIASRPGLAIPALVGRHFDYPMVNLGFCGVGRMDPPVVELLAELDPIIYVIDCMPNMTAELLNERMEPLVKRLRQAHPETPILFVEVHNHPTPGLFPADDRTLLKNQQTQQAIFDRLVKAGVKGLHYLPAKDLIGNDSEGTGDSLHPNALGMTRFAALYETALRPILDAELHRK